MPVSHSSSGTAMELKAKTNLLQLGCYFTFSWKHYLIKSCIFLQEQISYITTGPMQVVLVSFLHMFAHLPCYWWPYGMKKKANGVSSNGTTFNTASWKSEMWRDMHTERQIGCPCCLSLSICVQAYFPPFQDKVGQKFSLAISLSGLVYPTKINNKPQSIF